MKLVGARHQQNYLEYYQQLDDIDQRPSRWQPLIQKTAEDHGCRALLDYGCGGYPRLEKHLPAPYIVTSYDPALPGYDLLPATQFDMVICIDVLEHVEAVFLDEVIAYLKGSAKKVLLVSVSTSQSTKLLPDGAPWHCNVHDPEYWDAKFPEATVIDNSDGRKEITYLWIK